MSKILFIFIAFLTNLTIASAATENDLGQPILVCKNAFGQLANATLKVSVYASNSESQENKVLITKESPTETIIISKGAATNYRMADASNTFSNAQILLNISSDQSGQVKGKLSFPNEPNNFYFILDCNEFYQIQPIAQVEE